MLRNWRVILGLLAMAGWVAAAWAGPAQTFKRGGWDPPTGGWDIVWDAQHFAADGWINGNSSSDCGPDLNYRTWNDNWDPDDVTTQTVALAGETEDGANPATDAIVLQLKDDSPLTSGWGFGRRLKFALPLPGTYDTRPDNTVRNPELNFVNVNKGATIVVRFRVMPGTLMEPDWGIGERVFAQSFVGVDCSDGDEDQCGLAVGNDMVRWTTDIDTKSTPILVGDMTARHRTFWIVFEPGVNLNNWQGTLYVDGQTSPVAPTMGGPGDAGPNGTFAGAADGDQSLTENWFMYPDQIETNAGASNYPEHAGKAFLLIGPGRSGATVTWQYDYICFKAGAHRPAAAPTQPPTAPSSLTATAVVPGGGGVPRVSLTWTDNSNNESGFKIERQEGTTGTFTQIDIAPADAASYDDAMVQYLQSYIYRIRATNAAGDSAYSNETSVTLPAAPAAARDWRRYRE